MAINRTTEDSFAAATEVAVGQIASGGAFATLTLESHSIEVESAEMTVNATDVSRDDYPDASMGDLPVIPGARSWNISVTVPARFDGAGTLAEVDPLLKASGLAEASDVYTPTATITRAVVEMMVGTMLKRAFGCSFNARWEGQAGDISRFIFEGRGLHFDMEELAIGGSTYTVDAIAPPVVDSINLQFAAGSNSEAAFTTPYATGFSFDLGNTVQARTQANHIALPNYKVLQDDGGVFTDETTDSNSAAAGDVAPFAATPAVSDAYYIGSPHPFVGVKHTISTAGSTTMTVVWEYYDGAAWSTLPFTNPAAQQVTDFDEVAATYFNLFDPPTDWTPTAVNSTTAYWIRARVSAFTAIVTQALVTQVWTLYAARGAESYFVANRKPRLTLTVEMEDDGTFDPVREWRRRSTRDITFQVGAANNNTIQFRGEDMVLAQEPETVRDGGLVRYTLVYQQDKTETTPFSITFT